MSHYNNKLEFGILHNRRVHLASTINCKLRTMNAASRTSEVTMMRRLLLLTIGNVFLVVFTRTRPYGCDMVMEVTAWSIQPQTPSVLPTRSILFALTNRRNVVTKRRRVNTSFLWSRNDDSDDTSRIRINTVTTSSSPSSSVQSTLPSGKKQELEASIEKLKRVIEREYITFFNPMECDYYRNDVTFIDPLTTLTGIDSYLNNVNMLSGRTLLGSILFRDARIILHTITGGTVQYNDDTNTLNIDNIITRWTLKFTFQILPWQPSPSFTGISVYSLQVGGPNGVQVVQQNDYWDSINLQPGGSYTAVSNRIAIQHFVSLLRPGATFQAKSAGPELPYTTLRLKGTDYEVRRYPAYTAIAMIYERRDEAFVTMGSYTSGMNPMAPAIIQVNSTDPKNVIKTMLWPIRYELPNASKQQQPVPTIPTLPDDMVGSDRVSIVTIPESVVAIRTFSDMIVEPLVRKVDQTLRQCLQRDGLLPTEPTNHHNNANDDDDEQVPTTTPLLLTFAQYDAIYSMGERRCEVHVSLPNGTHPW